jgi:DNA topoisomerase-2
MMKRSDGVKTSRISGIVKLEDANNAGSRKGKDCTLILTEGDSAKALAVSGLSVVGRDNYGVFPLRGKLLNVREAATDQILKNTEIQHIKQIMGLKHKHEYTSVDGLRYGSLMIMTDQDHDGSHIKGLIINFLDHFYPSLLKIPNFLVEFITPIVKVWKGKQTHTFYTMPEYEEWKEANNNGKGWESKYYKVSVSDFSPQVAVMIEALRPDCRVWVPLPLKMPRDTSVTYPNTSCHSKKLRMEIES